MTYDPRGTLSLAPAPDVGVPGGLEGALLEPGEGTGGDPAGTGGSAGDAGKLSATAKLHIEREAKRAAWDGRTRADACRYNYDTPAGEHWTAAYVLAGGLIR